jgi:telomerase reverse transcriptase
VNNVLRDAHTILKGIQFKEPKRLGSSVFDYNDVYKKLCPFLVDQKKGLTPMSSLFIITSDVSKAFDSVDQDKLLTIMEDVLWDEYFIKEYDQVICTKNSLWVQKQSTLLNEANNTGHTQFRSFASSWHAVFVNQVSFFILLIGVGESHMVQSICIFCIICSVLLYLINFLTIRVEMSCTSTYYIIL